MPSRCQLCCSQFTTSLSQPLIIEKSEKMRLLSMSMSQDKSTAESKSTPGFHLFSVCPLLLSPVRL